MNLVRTPLMDEAAVRDALRRMATELIGLSADPSMISLLGIRRRGDHIAVLLKEELERLGVKAPVGALDITFYRDDLATVGPRPVVGETELPAGGIDDRIVVLVDDVLHTGRTIRAALNELNDWGRPARTLLCVLAVRDGRELPIQADLAGISVEDVLPHQRVEAAVPALDGRLGLDLVEVAGEAE